MNASMIKHFSFDGDGRGRVAVALTEDGKFFLDTIAGQCPPVRILFRILEQWPEMVEALNALNYQRQHRTATDVRYGMSGAENYLLIEERNPALADYPTRARLHVSMYGKLNQGIAMWGGDLVELVSAVSCRHERISDKERREEALTVTEVATRSDLQWNDPIRLGVWPDGILSMRGRDIPDAYYDNPEAYHDEEAYDGPQSAEWRALIEDPASAGAKLYIWDESPGDAGSARLFVLAASLNEARNVAAAGNPSLPGLAALLEKAPEIRAAPAASWE